MHLLLKNGFKGLGWLCGIMHKRPAKSVTLVPGAQACWAQVFSGLALAREGSGFKP
jgi:hypothetical protein